VKLAGEDADRVVEYVRRAMLRDPATRSYLTLWFLSRVDLETGRYRSELLPLSYDFVQTVAKLLGYDVDRLRKMGLLGESVAEEAEEGEEEEEGGGKRRGKAYYPLLFEVLGGTSAKTTWHGLSQIVPGRAVYLGYLALHEAGSPAVRAGSIREKVATWSDVDVAEAASIAVVLLETARDADLGFKQAQTEGLSRFIQGAPGSEAGVVRELAVRTLLNLLPRT